VTLPAAALVEPGRGAGLRDVVRNRFLLRLIVRQEMRVRYRGSVLGLFWSYIKPALQFSVYFFALGIFLKVNRSLPNFAVYLFSGLVVINFVGEALGNSARSVVRNAPLVKKIYLPRELFPVATTYVAAIHLLPQVVILLLGALVAGWVPSLTAVGSAALGFALVAVLVTGLGLFLAGLNVYFRDFENIVDLVLIVVTWASPVLYPWTYVQQALGSGWGLQLYLVNPLTVATQLFQRAFWAPTAPGVPQLIPHLWICGGLELLAALGVLGAGQLVFRRLEGRFAQEL